MKSNRNFVSDLKSNLNLAIFGFFLLGAFGIPNAALAQYRENLKTSGSTPADLMSETQELKISGERSVQRENPPAHIFVSVDAGLVNLGSFNVPGADQVTHYDMNHFVPTMGVSLQDFPTLWGGRWGILGSAGYSYAEFNAVRPIAMHVVPLAIEGVYRYRTRDRQLLIPYAEFGPAAFMYIQRGIDQDNTSGISYALNGGLGVALNLNELGLFDGRNQMEIEFQYSRNVMNFSSTTAFSADQISAAATMLF